MKECFKKIQDEKSQLRAERALERNKFNVMSDSIELMLNKFNEDEADTVINWDELASTIVGEIYHVNDDVCFIPVSLTSHILEFITVVDSDGEFGLQEHDIVEYVKVLKGQLISPLQDFHITNAGDVFKYPAYTKHKPKGGKTTNIYWVTFKK